MKSSFSGLTLWLSGTLTLSALALVGCGGGGSSNGGNSSPTPVSTPLPGSTPSATAVPGTTPSATPIPTSAQVSTILFVSNRDGNAEIYSMRSDGLSQTRLTNSPAAESSPSRARNGSRIVFSSERDGNPEIYTMGITGETSDLRRLTSDADTSRPDDTEPTFSPTGNRIAWISTRGGSANVWLMDSTGANQSQFTTEGNISSPAFSTDGAEVAFSVVRGGVGVIVAKNIASGSERTLAQGTFSALSPHYNPNGNQLVFTARTPGSDARRLQIVNLTTGAISDGPGGGNGSGNFALEGTFSPEGNRLAFDAASTQSPQIAVSGGLTGPEITVLTSQGQNFSPFWGQ